MKSSTTIKHLNWIALLAVSFGLWITPARAAQPVIANSGSASAITTNSAVMSATINPNGATGAAYSFGWWSSASSSHNTPPQNLSSANTPITVSATLTGLSAQTTYFFHIVIAPASGAPMIGSTQSFTTLPAQATSAPIPSSQIIQTPAPTANIVANMKTITVNTPVTIAWMSTNTSSCTINPGGWNTTFGNQVVTPTISTTYTVSCSGPGGSAAASVSIIVTPPPPASASQPGAGTTQPTSNTITPSTNTTLPSNGFYSPMIPTAPSTSLSQPSIFPPVVPTQNLPVPQTTSSCSNVLNNIHTVLNRLKETGRPVNPLARALNSSDMSAGALTDKIRSLYLNIDNASLTQFETYYEKAGLGYDQAITKLYTAINDCNRNDAATALADFNAAKANIDIMYSQINSALSFSPDMIKTANALYLYRSMMLPIETSLAYVGPIADNIANYTANPDKLDTLNVNLIKSVALEEITISITKYFKTEELINKGVGQSGIWERLAPIKDTELKQEIMKMLAHNTNTDFNDVFSAKIEPYVSKLLDSLGNTFATSKQNSAPPLYAAPLNIPDGTIIQIADSPTLYLVMNGDLRPFISPAAFAARGLAWSQVQQVTPTQIDPQFIRTEPVPMPDGSIVKGSSPTVYIIYGGTKYGIPSLMTFQRLGLSLNNLFSISDNDLQAYPDGGIQN